MVTVGSREVPGQIRKIPKIHILIPVEICVQRNWDSPGNALAGNELDLFGVLGMVWALVHLWCSQWGDLDVGVFVVGFGKCSFGKSKSCSLGRN